MPFDAIAHFAQTLPHRPYAMHHKPGRCSPIAAAKAAGVPYIQVNPPAMVHWLVFDLDHEFASIQWRDAGVPPPTLLVGSPETGTAHYYYGLRAPVCRSDAARARPLRYLAAIEAGLREEFEADPGYTGFIAKCPLWTGWSVHQLGDLYDLSDLSRWALPWDQCRRPAVEQSGLGRNSTLFDRLRAWAYHERRKHPDRDLWEGAVLSAAEGFNDFFDPLPWSEVKSTAKSVAKWVSARYTGTGSGRNRGVMALDKSLELPTRQRLGAGYTAATKSQRTADRVDAACRGLRNHGKPVTPTTVSGWSGVSISTVKRHLRRQQLAAECV